MNKVTGM